MPFFYFDPTYILVIIAYRNDTNVVIVTNQFAYKRKFILSHILCFVNHKDGFCNPTSFDLTAHYRIDSFVYDILRVVDGTDSTQKVKTIGVKSPDFHIFCRIANQISEPFAEFCGCGSGKGQHQKLFGLHVFHKNQ